MKKILLCVILACCNIWIMQAEEKQYLGVQLGYTQPITRLNAAIVGKETTLNATVYNGLKVGVVYDATIVKGFGFNMGLNYTFGSNHTNWQNINNNVSTAQRRFKRQYHQMELVVDWQYKFEIAQNTWLMLYTGPTLQCGFSIKESTFERKGPGQPEEESATKDYYQDKVDNQYSPSSLSRLNVTWGIGAGLQYERYFLRGGYDFGLINPYKAKTFNISENYQPYTRGRFDQWQIKLGIYLWEK